MLRGSTKYTEYESRLNPPITSRLFSLARTVGRQQSTKRIDIRLSQLDIQGCLEQGRQYLRAQKT